MYLSLLVMGKYLNESCVQICFYVLYKIVKNRILSYLLSPSTLPLLYLHSSLPFGDHLKLN